ncbi:MAG: N-acetylmuramoyl-L-alanine amidase [Bacilli bacterium]
MLRYKICVLFLFVIGLCTFSFFQVDAEEPQLIGKIIYLDAGHGGIDPGALYKNIKEKDINLQIVLKLKESLEKKGATVYLTRYGDYDLSLPNAINSKRSDLSRRANIINDSLCDIYISVHLNAEISNSWNGAQIFYDNVNKNNEKLAQIMQEEFKRSTKTKRKYKLINEMYMFKRIKRVGILIEAGFITNPNERYILRKDWYQTKIVNIINNGILKYFSQI